jgi:hypothetical protein
MSDERLFFTPTAEPNSTGVSGLLAGAKASEVKYKDRCKMHILASPEVGWTPRRIGRYSGSPFLPSLLAGSQSDRGRLESAETPHLSAPASSHKVRGTH